MSRLVLHARMSPAQGAGSRTGAEGKARPARPSGNSCAVSHYCGVGQLKRILPHRNAKILTYQRILALKPWECSMLPTFSDSRSKEAKSGPSVACWHRPVATCICPQRRHGHGICHAPVVVVCQTYPFAPFNPEYVRPASRPPRQPLHWHLLHPVRRGLPGMRANRHGGGELGVFR